MRVATGVTARARPPSSPAPGPNVRRNVAHNSATEATAISTCGTSMLQLFIPKRRAEISIGHNAAGVLSTVIELPQSEEPKKNAFHDCAPDCTAAA